MDPSLHQPAQAALSFRTVRTAISHWNPVTFNFNYVNAQYCMTAFLVVKVQNQSNTPNNIVILTKCVLLLLPPTRKHCVFVSQNNRQI